MNTSLRSFFIYYGLQPAILLAVFVIACTQEVSLAVTATVLVGVQLLLGVIERHSPLNQAWVVRGIEKWQHFGFFVIYSLSAALILEGYHRYVADVLDSWRITLGLDLWPHEWPIAARICLALVCSEFIWYWLHRLEHRYAFIWRISSHGVHHSFKKLNALNFNTNHPIEALVIALPAVLVAFLLGAGTDSQAALLLIIANTSCAHANIALNTKGIGWIFTTNAWHFRHHSVVMPESNTNYGCMLIFWDRLFGTFEESIPAELGTGSREPSFKEKMLMPIREPEGSNIAPPG